MSDQVGIQDDSGVAPTRLPDPESNLFRDLVESSQELFWQVDSQGRYRYLNPAWETVFGYRLDQMLGRSFSDFQTPEIAARDLATLTEMMGKAFFNNYETVLLRKDGIPVHAVFSGKRVLGSDGAFLGMQGVGYDITPRKQAEMELRASEERYRKLSDSAFEGIMIHDNGEILEMNQAFLDMFGYRDKSEMVGVNSLKTLIAPRSLAQIRKRIENEETGAAEVYCLRRDGTEFVGETQSRVILFEGRRARIVTMNDITESKRAEAALAAERERLAVTLRSIGDGVIATDTAGRVVILNTIAEKLTGWSQAEAVGKPLAEVFHIINELTREVCWNPVEKVIATGEIIELANHTVLISRDGAERIIEDSGAPIRDHEGRTIGVVLVFRDTTEKKKFTVAAQRAQKLESLGILAGGIAHDFNNLLGGIFGYVDLVHAKSKDPATAHYLEKALSTIDRARALTQQLLTFASGGVPVRKVAALFPMIEDTVRFVLSGTSISCVFQVASDLRACEIDRNQICQVVENLVINAQQAMPLGGALVVTARNLSLMNRQVHKLPAGEYVRVSIKDSGIGITAEIQARIFDPFFTTKQKGSGLGLATCYSILTQHNGSIEVESEPGHGSTFHITLPSSTRSPDPEPIVPGHKIRGQGLFLIMDDEEVIRETFGEMLRMMGYEVQEFEDGTAVLEYLRAQPEGFPGITAILLDLTVPGGMGGLDTAVQIRKLNGKIPIFIASGYADDLEMSKQEQNGITASISKPFRISALTELLQKHL